MLLVGSYPSFHDCQVFSAAKHIVINLAVYAPGRISPWPWQELCMIKVSNYGNTRQYSPLQKEEILHTSAYLVLGKSCRHLAQGSMCTHRTLLVVK